MTRGVLIESKHFTLTLKDVGKVVLAVVAFFMWSESRVDGKISKHEETPHPDVVTVSQLKDAVDLLRSDMKATKNAYEQMQGAFVSLRDVVVAAHGPLNAQRGRE